MKKLSRLTTERKITEPDSARALEVMGWIVIACGVIAGFALAQQEVTYGHYYTYTQTEFVWAVAIAYWAAGIISGTMMIGFGKIIELLSDIANKNYITEYVEEPVEKQTEENS